jgi:tRNA-Thr(GGU) m(6)t(6)A37 methyltransferase TsaA
MNLMDQDHFKVYPIGTINKTEQTTTIKIAEKYLDALLGLDQFSHMVVCYWFHQNDQPEKRAVLQVYPRKDKRNPLSGVFATHSPLRPNLIALSICEILSVKVNRIWVDKIDAFDQTPVLDIKPLIPSRHLKDVKLPAWV